MYNYVGTVSTQTTLALRASMLVNESEPAVENVNVTVVDAGRTYQLAVAPNGSVRDQVAYQAPAGKVLPVGSPTRLTPPPLTWTRLPRTPPSTPSTSAIPIWTWITAAPACSVSVASP